MYPKDEAVKSLPSANFVNAYLLSSYYTQLVNAIMAWSKSIHQSRCWFNLVIILMNCSPLSYLNFCT